MKRRGSLLLAVLILAALASWLIRDMTARAPSRIVLQVEPKGVMGTVSKLAAITVRRQASVAQQALDSAEAEMRRLEALLSTWIESSQISRFNAAPAGETMELNTEVVEVLRLAQGSHVATSGVFDITILPLVELWRNAAERNLTPSPESLRFARAESAWDQIRIDGDGVAKTLSSTRVDVDGIAKGYAIDKTLALLQKSDLSGGLVEIGGDLKVFGAGPTGETWTVAIRSPFEDQVWAEIEIQEGAVCTSGDYARYLEIDGRRFGHILDPRSGQPVVETQAVTVVGRDAATADVWATALSILGVAGLDLLPADEDLAALIVTGGPDDYKVKVTPGFRQILIRASFDLTD